eukprot:1111407-Pyramimonas_sp.AAC.1
MRGLAAAGQPRETASAPRPSWATGETGCGAHAPWGRSGLCRVLLLGLSWELRRRVLELLDDRCVGGDARRGGGLVGGRQQGQHDGVRHTTERVER